MKGRILIFLFCLVSGKNLLAQISSDCSTAIPICSNTPVNSGTDGYSIDDFQGAPASGCLERSSSGAIESNSAWYRFRTGAAGQLGFNIQHDPSEDWDFALYRTDACSQLGEPIRCNFFDNRDQNSYIGVGEDPSGDALTVQYEDWLAVEPGEEYYLLINNFSNINSGFSIQFSGSIFQDFPDTALDCSIIDNLLGSARILCENETTELDASSPGAVGYQWYADFGAGFNALPGEDNPSYTATQEGVYRVVIDMPDLTNIISDVQVSYTQTPVAFDVDNQSYCIALGQSNAFDLSQLDLQALGNQDPNQFMVSYHHSRQDAEQGVGALPLSYQKPAGSEVVFVRVSSRVNPNCFDASQNFELSAVSEPVLNIPLQQYICGGTSGVLIGDSNPNPAFTYEWSTGQSGPEVWIDRPGEYELVVRNSWRNSFCELRRTIVVESLETPRIREIKVEDLQALSEIEVIMDQPGNYEFSIDGGPFQTGRRFDNLLPGTHQLTVRNALGCDAVQTEIVVVGFPANFTPNGDVFNQNWHIQGLEYLEEAVVHIYDRSGKLLKQVNADSEGWDGTYLGKPQPQNDYWFKLIYRDARGNRSEAKYLKTHFSLIR